MSEMDLTPAELAALPVGQVLFDGDNDRIRKVDREAYTYANLPAGTPPFSAPRAYAPYSLWPKPGVRARG